MAPDQKEEIYFACPVFVREIIKWGSAEYAGPLQYSCGGEVSSKKSFQRGFTMKALKKHVLNAHGPTASTEGMALEKHQHAFFAEDFRKSNRGGGVGTKKDNWYKMYDAIEGQYPRTSGPYDLHLPSRIMTKTFRETSAKSDWEGETQELEAGSAFGYHEEDEDTEDDPDYLHGAPSATTWHPGPTTTSEPSQGTQDTMNTPLSGSTADFVAGTPFDGQWDTRAFGDDFSQYINANYSTTADGGDYQYAPEIDDPSSRLYNREYMSSGSRGR